jgi:hypothetical protein
MASGCARSYRRIGKLAFIQHQRYAHAKQFKRANRALRTLRIQLGRLIRDIGRKIGENARLRAIFAWPLSLARRVREQRQTQRGRKLYSLYVPEVERIGKGKAHRPYEFGVKVSGQGRCGDARAVSSSPMRLRCQAIRLTAIRCRGDSRHRAADRRFVDAHHRRQGATQTRCRVTVAICDDGLPSRR